MTMTVKPISSPSSAATNHFNNALCLWSLSTLTPRTAKEEYDVTRFYEHLFDLINTDPGRQVGHYLP